MSIYLIRELIPTYASTEIEADSEEEALKKAADPENDWSYDSDYDSAKFLDIVKY